MAPSLTATTVTETPDESIKQKPVVWQEQYDEPKKTESNGDNKSGVRYPHYLPTYNHAQKYPPLEPFEHIERGKFADPTFPNLLPQGTKVRKLTPTTGTEITGVQLSQLSNAGKDELALLTAQRKVVVFRDQDFADLPIQQALDFGGYFGRHHIHATTGSPEGYPEVLVVYRADKGSDTTWSSKEFETKNSSVAWHSDVSYEEQPPGTTFLYALETPETGGDTMFNNQVEAYNRLSAALKQRLHGLKAVHTGFGQIQHSRDSGGVVRREPVKTIHPLIRTHPATGEKALYINKSFVESIVGLKKEESDALIAFLTTHIAVGADFQLRVNWAPRTIVVWDNRVTCHSALKDWTTGELRHLARLTPQAERPFETPYVEGS